MHTTPIKCLNSLKTEFKTLRLFDDKNQNIFSGGSSAKGLTKSQMFYLTEAIFFASFRCYEQFLRNVFLLYCCGRQSSGRKSVRSYLQPKNIKHAEMLVKSSMPFLDWSSPDVLIERTESYLKDGYPMKIPLSTNIENLRDLKKIRNHIAHMSRESTSDFTRVVRSHYGTRPLNLPRPGEYLLLSCRNNSSTYYLEKYMKVMEDVAEKVT